MNIRTIFTASIIIVISIVFSSIYFFRNQNKMTKYHKLESPLLLSSDKSLKNMHMLPKGTMLYFDQSYPEGFTRYKIYINVDRMPLQLKELSDPTSIEPIDAYAPEKDDLKKLLKNYPLTREELITILKTSSMSREDIKEILVDFVK